MTRILLNLALLFFFLFVAFIGLIGARPVNQHELRTFLLPSDGCLAPCWQGIRPGVTTADEAMALLGHHPWVASLLYRSQFYFDSIDSLIDIEWSGRQPAWINEEFHGVIGVHDSVVRWIAFATTVPLGDMLLALEQTEVDTDHPYFYYSDNRLTIGFAANRRSVRRFYAPTGITIGEVPQILLSDEYTSVKIDYWPGVPVNVVYSR